MKTLISRLLLSGLLLYLCHNARNQPVESSPGKAPMPPFHFAYYEYGGPPELHLSKAQAVVLRHYGLSYQGFGCVVTDSLIRAIRQHNDSLFTRLQKQFPGLDEDRLRQEIKTTSSPAKPRL